MKRLFYATTFLAMAACHPPSVNAMPQANSFNKPPLDSCLSERRKSREKEIIDVFRSGNEMRVLHPGGIRFIQKERKRITLAIGEGKILSEEAVFNRNAVAGRFLPDGRALVLFEDGKLSRLDFSDSKPMTFLLFEKLPKSQVEIHVAGNSYWFILKGTPDIVKVRWEGEKDVTVSRVRCRKIGCITSSMKAVCGKEHCRIFIGSKLLEEIKESK